MKIRVNEDITTRIHEGYEERILRTGIVTCSMVDCCNNNKIECSKCYLDGWGEGSLSVEYSKVKVDPQEE